MCGCQIGKRKKIGNMKGSLKGLTKSLVKVATTGAGAVAGREVAKLIPANIKTTITPYGEAAGLMVLGAFMPMLSKNAQAKDYLESFGAGVATVGALKLYDTLVTPAVAGVGRRNYVITRGNRMAGADNRGAGVAGMDNRGAGIAGAGYRSAMEVMTNKYGSYSPNFASAPVASF